MARSDVLVTADWAEEQSRRRRTSSSSRSTRTPPPTTSGHIAGAVKLDWKTDLQDQVRRDFVNKEQFEKLLSERGHRQRRHRRPLRRQQQLVRRLRVLVLQALRPRRRQAARRRPQEVGARRPRADRPTLPSRAATSLHRARSRTPRIRAFRDEVVAAIGAKNLVDVRSPDEFAGRLLAPAHLPQEQAQRAGPHPDRRQRAVEQGGQRGRHLQVRRRAREALRRGRPGRRARTPSPTAGSVSARRTPGSCCRSCSASRTSRTTTAVGPSTAPWSASRSSWEVDMCSAPKQGLTLPASVDLEKETVITGRVVDGAGQAGRRRVRAPARLHPTSSPPRSSRRPPVTSGSSPRPARGRCARCPRGQRRRQRGTVRRGHPRGRRQGRLTTSAAADVPTRLGSPAQLSTAAVPGVGTSRLAARGAVLRDHARRGRRGHHVVRAVRAVPAHHRRVREAFRGS